MQQLLRDIDAVADPDQAAALARYFQARPGGYAEGDRFVGVKLSRIRQLARPYQRADLPMGLFEDALASPVHEHRLAALVLMADRATRASGRGDAADLERLADCYLRNTDRVNNWDLVDCSAPAVVGGWLMDRPREILDALVTSPSVWERRIALVATHRFIRSGDAADTYRLAAKVLDDPHGLIHKAAGWMLREAGARVDEAALLSFLDRYAARMPRTMLRYSIERLAPDVRLRYRQLT